jgi:hypothetical protein
VQDSKIAVLAKLMERKGVGLWFFFFSLIRTKVTIFVVSVSFRFVSLVQSDELICYLTFTVLGFAYSRILDVGLLR